MPDAQIHFTGNLGGEPDIRYTQAGVPVCSASVAVNKTKKVANTGDPKQDFETIHTTWYRVTWWRELAELVSSLNLVKGQSVTIDGEVYEEEYATNDGGAGKSLKVTARGIVAHPKRDQQAQQTGYTQQRPQVGQQQGYGQAQQGGWGGQQNGDDSPPF